MPYRILGEKESARLASLDPVWRETAVRVVDEINLNLTSDSFARVVVTSGRRSYADQLEIWGRGRVLVSADADPMEPASWKQIGRVVTSSFPGLSAHNYGLAVDVALLNEGGHYLPNDDPRWALIGDVADEFDCEWGGRWRLRDFGHIQARHWREIKRP
jgi:hypothetical protein